MWVPPEVKDPMQLHAPTRKSMACFGAVSLLTGKFVRLATHNRYFATLDELIKAATSCFDRWRTPNLVRRCLCGII